MKEIDREKYSGTIKAMRRKKRCVIAVTFIAIITIITLCSPMELVILEETIIDYDGINPVFTVLLVILCLIIELIAVTMVVNVPVVNSINIECDPEKYLVLGEEFLPSGSLNSVYSLANLYLGNYKESIAASEMLMSHKDVKIVLSGIYNKARCEFLLGDYDSMKASAEKYIDILSNTDKLSKNAEYEHFKISDSIKLMCALADDNLDKIKEYGDNVRCYNESKATEGFINYLKGLSAYRLGDKTEAVYRLKSVKENCPKMIIASISDEVLASMNVE